MTKPLYVNKAIERELAQFKVEIQDKYVASDMNRSYSFPRASVVRGTPLMKIELNDERETPEKVQPKSNKRVKMASIKYDTSQKQSKRGNKSQ